MATRAQPWGLTSPNPNNTGEATPSERPLSNLASAFMQQHDRPGLSVAVFSCGPLIYEDAFGFTEMIGAA